MIKERSTFLADERRHCVAEATMGGESSYTDLLTCLEMARDVRQLRSEANNSSAPAQQVPQAPVGHRQPTGQIAENGQAPPCAIVIRDRHPGIVFNAHYIVDGAIVFKNACALGCEGIVSKPLGSPYRAGRSAHWIKVKNPDAPAVKREAEEWSS